MLAEHPFLILAGSIFFLIITFVAVILIPTAIVRTAINNNLTKTQKILWILGELFISPLTYIYLLVVEKKLWLRILSALVIFAAIAALAVPQTREVLSTVYMSPANKTAFEEKMIKLHQDATISSAQFCQTCISADAEQAKECLDHIKLHLTLFSGDIAAHRAYCSNTPLTPEIAKQQIAAWCKRVGPNYPFPEPRWQTMYAALSEKYPCPMNISQ